MIRNQEQAEALRQSGERDLLTLQLLIESGHAPHESIGFHAQQAVRNFSNAFWCFTTLSSNAHMI